jgi:Flp pilus assembly protein TadG
LETAALLPLIIFFSFVVFQVGVAMWTMVEADTAVRSAARAASLNPDNIQGAAAAAAASSLPGALAVDGPVTALPMAVNGVDGVTVTLGVQIPGLHVKFMPSTVTRHADMPITR